MIPLDELTLEQRIIRLDMLMCLFFGAIIQHPMATSLVPPAELEKLREILPNEPTESMATQAG
jgi:hypothetical protein